MTNDAPSHRVQAQAASSNITWHKGFGPKTEQQLELGGWQKAMERRSEYGTRQGSVFTRPLPFQLVIEGNIGSGKSSLLPALAQSLEDQGHPVLQQPENVEHWQANGLLEMLYSGGSAESLIAFQTLGPIQDAINRYNEIDSWDPDWNRSENKFPIVISERSARSSYNVFLEAAPHLFDERKSHAITLLKDFYTSIDLMTFGEILCLADGTIFLTTPPRVCFNRTVNRSRAEELNSAASIGYLQTLDTLHFSMFKELDELHQATYAVDSSELNVTSIVTEFMAMWTAAKLRDDARIRQLNFLQEITLASQPEDDFIPTSPGAPPSDAFQQTHAYIPLSPRDMPNPTQQPLPLQRPTTFIEEQLQDHSTTFVRPSVRTRMRSRAADMEDLLGSNMSQDGPQYFGDATFDPDDPNEDEASSEEEPYERN